MMDVRKRIIELRKAAELSQTQLAALAGISQPSLSSIEKGYSQATVQTIEGICQALGITLADFFSEDPIIDEPMDNIEYHLLQDLSCDDLSDEEKKEIELAIRVTLRMIDEKRKHK